MCFFEDQGCVEVEALFIRNGKIRKENVTPQM